MHPIARRQELWQEICTWRVGNHDWDMSKITQKPANTGKNKRLGQATRATQF